MCLDYTYRFALNHLKNYHPRVLHISFGETDDWAHGKNYEQMLKALNRTDQYFKGLWDFLQSDKQYKDKTSIIITVDHGRGATEKDWHGHGDEIPDARYISRLISNGAGNGRMQKRFIKTKLLPRFVSF